jgi:hypothetical protein
VQPIFTRECATSGCHDAARARAGLDLSAGAAYGALVGVTATQCSGTKKLVVAGDLAASYLMSKLTGVGMCSGSQMPKAGTSLPAPDLDSITSWICGGALDN